MGRADAKDWLDVILTLHVSPYLDVERNGRDDFISPRRDGVFIWQKHCRDEAI